MILVTGGSGLLGEELIRQLLAAGEKVKAIFNRTPLVDFNRDNFSPVPCDIFDPLQLEEVMEGVSEVYHCAGFVSFSPRDRLKLYEVNAEGTANVVNAALAKNIRKLVHVSSVAALGRIRVNEQVSETMQWSKETSNGNYGESKFYGEMEVWRAMAEGLNAVIVNPSIILGAGNWNEGSTKIFQSLYNEFPWYSEGRTGFVDVRDVATAMRLLMNSEISNERFIMSAENRTYREVFDMISDCFGKKRAEKKVTPFLASLVWRIESLRSKFSGEHPLITRETAATALASVTYDNSKLLKYLPAFRYHPLTETITHTCTALQQKVNKR